MTSVGNLISSLGRSSSHLQGFSAPSSISFAGHKAHEHPTPQKTDQPLKINLNAWNAVQPFPLVQQNAARVAGRIQSPRIPYNKSLNLTGPASGGLETSTVFKAGRAS